MLADVSARSALIGALGGNHAFSSMPTTAMVQHTSERQRGRPPDQSDGAMICSGALREGQTAPKIPSNKGLQPAISPRTIREFQYSRLSENVLLSAW